VSRVPRVVSTTASNNRETTNHRTNNTPASSPASTSDVRQPAASVIVQTSGLQDNLNNNAQRYDNDNDDSVVQVVDLSGKGRLSNVECSNVVSEAGDLESSLKLTSVDRMQSD